MYTKQKYLSFERERERARATIVSLELSFGMYRVVIYIEVHIHMLATTASPYSQKAYIYTVLLHTQYNKHPINVCLLKLIRKSGARNSLCGNICFQFTIKEDKTVCRNGRRAIALRCVCHSSCERKRNVPIGLLRLYGCAEDVHRVFAERGKHTLLILVERYIGTRSVFASVNLRYLRCNWMRKIIWTQWHKDGFFFFVLLFVELKKRWKMFFFS